MTEWIPATMRPGVYTQVDVRRVYPAVPGRGGAAAVARAAAGEVGKAVRIQTVEQAEAFGAESALCGMARVLLAAGVSPVYAARAEEGRYAEAFAALAAIEGLCAVAADGGADALAAHADSCAANGNERIGILAAAAPDEACETAKRLNRAHLAVACDGGTATHLTAAAFAALVAQNGAREGFSGAELPHGAEQFDGALSEMQVETLLRAGVTPFERRGDRVECIRAVTTATHSGGVPDRTLSSLSAVLAADEVTAAVRGAVRARLHGLRNSTAARESIASQITVELERKRQEGVIDSFLPPVVAAHPNDPAVCVATLAVKVAPEISQIVITAEIQV